MVKYDLLKDPLITVRHRGGGEERLNLPEILEELAGGEDPEFPALRPHQQQPWYCFLVQLASLALHRSEKRVEAFPAGEWRSILLNLAEGKSEAFRLVVEELSKPAFLQPPVPEGSLKGFKKSAVRPDELDMLVTSKNHDLKSSIMSCPRPEHWLFSLLTLQTMEGFLGAGNYGIVRMNGGFASRPFVGYAPSLQWGERFRRDVGILLSRRQELAASHEYSESDGKSLIWLEPWDGSKSLELRQCDPYFIEVCRRLRLVEAKNRIFAALNSSKAPRIAPRESHGDTGDPWTPIHVAEKKALNIGASGFPYDLARRLILTEDFRPGLCQGLQRGDHESMLFVAGALARKQGGTEGLHRRVIPIPSRVRFLMSAPSGREKLHKLSSQRVKDVSDWKRVVLHPSLCALLQGKVNDFKMKEPRARKWEDRFDAGVDRIFFPDLWDDAELSEEKAARKWNFKMMELAKAELESAAASMPIPTVRRFRGEAFGRMVFERCARKYFGALFAPEGGEENES